MHSLVLLLYAKTLQSGLLIHSLLQEFLFIVVPRRTSLSNDLQYLF